jgi:hypothetical protein
MPDEFSATKESIREVLASLRAERVMSERGLYTGLQASSTKGVQASPLTSQAKKSRASTEIRTKHKDNMANAKLVPSILPAYIPPLSGAIKRDSVPRYFEYTLVMTYLPKGVCTVHANQDKITTLMFSDFNLGDCKVYNILALYKYLTRTKGNNLKILPQQWMMNLAQSTLLNVMKIPHFDRHQEVNSCVELLLASYHGGYLWLNHHIRVDPTLINQITRLSMQGPDPHDYYPGKTVDHALAQKIKESHGVVEKGMRGYKVASIESVAMRLTYQLVTGMLVRNNRPTQVSDFVVYLAGKCAEGLHMNWVKYLVNQLEIDCKEAQDQGHEFHFRYLLILIDFIAWELLEGATFPNIDPFEPLVVKFSTLWYSNNMNKKWKSNVIFHTYYTQLKIAIQSEPRMTLNTLQRFQPLIKFSANHHFIYMKTHADENKEQLQSYYKMTKEDLEEITKEWLTNLLILVDPAELFNINSP